MTRNVSKFRKLRSRLHQWGLRRTIFVLFFLLLDAARYWVWDLWHGVETRKKVLVSDLGIEGLNHANDAEAYVCASHRFLSRIREVNVDWKEFTFIDLGAGKGKTLLLAASLPFKKIIGVELSPKMVRIAEQNLTRNRHFNAQCKNLEIVLQDAAAYQFPLDPLVIYCFNPFTAAVMTEVLQNLKRSFQRLPRPVYWLYVNPVHKRLFSQCDFIHLMKEEEGFSLYGAEPPKEEPVSTVVLRIRGQTVRHATGRERDFLNSRKARQGDGPLRC